MNRMDWGFLGGHAVGCGRKMIGERKKWKTE